MKKFFIIILLSFNISSLSLAEDYKFTKITDLENPWGSSFINKNELIVTEKSGKIKIINIKSKKISEVEHNLNFLDYGQGGLLDILFKDNFVYISYSENRGNWKSSTSIAKTKFDKIRLDFKNIFQAEPPIDSGYHFGSRLVIKDNYLFASAGERG